MTEYLTTREVARYLRLNEKKIYALVSEGKLPAARISGKWLFPKELIDQWVDDHTVRPPGSLMGAVLEQMVVVQGSDDWLFSRCTERFLGRREIPVVSAKVGSLAGVMAVDGGRAHLAGCHVDNRAVQSSLRGSGGLYLIHLFSREQGLMLDAERHPGVGGPADVARLGLRFADRQPLSGTHRLARRLFEADDVPFDELERCGPYTSHLEVALAVRNGQAGAGLGIRVAAELAGLDFVPLATEPFKLAVPAALASHPHMAAFLEFVFDDLGIAARGGFAGYGFDKLGTMEAIGCDIHERPEV